MVFRSPLRDVNFCTKKKKFYRKLMAVLVEKLLILVIASLGSLVITKTKVEDGL